MKNILASILLCTFAAFTPVTTYAGTSDSDSANSKEISPNSEAREMTTNESTDLTTTADDEGNDYGWIGLIGLLGLAGLMKRDRVDTNRTPNR